MLNHKENKWRRYLILKAGISINAAAKDVERRKEKAISEDTILRKEIQNIIIGLVNKGKTSKEIKEILSSNSNYDKYSIYFDSWIKDRQKKCVTKNSENYEER